MSESAMDPTRESRAEEIFGDAIEVPEEKRHEFVSERCGDDHELRTRVEGFLESYLAAEALFEADPLRAQIRAWAASAAEAAAGSGPRPTPDPRIGRRVGAYRLIRFLGRGGMGRVYLAERCAGDFERQVAVKLIRPGRDSEDILQHFLDERQLLASLEHSNIARLLDGGSTRRGGPYIVMEYVDGVHIDRYCDGLTLALGQRLELFRSVCATVQYAHSIGVVHRDLKPENILVDRNGQPKLLDFGIAKVLKQGVFAMESERTETRRRRFSWRFASPEQIQGGKITTATDVYSLGVLLYELATGRSPYSDQNDRTTSPESLVCEFEPQPPSAVVTADLGGAEPASGAHRSPQARAAARRTTPERLAKLLKGDLDAIVLTAMHKDPKRRYASADGLSQDIYNHLWGRTVAARPDTLAYRVSRFVRRNRGLATAVVVAFLALGIGFGVSLVQYMRAVRARAETEWESYTSHIAAAESAIRTNRLAEARRQLESTPERFRGWEWRHLRARLDRSLVSVQAHAAAITDVAFGAGAKLVATSSEDRMVKLWDAETGEHIASLGPMLSVPRFLAVHPDRELVAVGCDSGVVVVLDRDNRIVARFEDERQQEQMHRLRLSEYEDDSEIVTLNRPLLAPTVAFDPTGTRLAAGFYVGNVRLWQVPSFRLLANWTTSQSPGRTLVAFSPDGATLATGSMSGDTPVQLWDLRSQRLLGALGATDTGQGCLVFGPDGDRLAWASVDGAIQIWSVRTGMMLLPMSSEGGSIRSLVFDRDGESVFTAATDQRVVARNVVSGRVEATLLGHTAGIQALTASRDGRKLASGDWRGILKLWDPRTQDVRTFHVPGLRLRVNWAEAAVPAADGSRLVSTLPPAGLAPILHIWEVATGHEYSAPIGPKALCLAACPGDSTVLAAGTDGFVALLDSRTGAVLWMVPAHAADIRSIAIDPSGKYFATGAHDSLVKIWDLETRRLIRVLSGHHGAVFGLAFGANAGTIVSCAQDSTIRMWDGHSGRTLSLPPGHHSGEVRDIAFDPDRRTLVSASFDGSVKEWDPSRGSLLGTLLQVESRLYAIAYAPDGSRVAAGGDDGIIHIIDMGTRREVARLFGHEGRILDLQFAKEGETLVSSSLDGTIRIWDTGAPAPHPGVAAPPQLPSLAGAIGSWCAEGDAKDSLGRNHAALLGGAGFAAGRIGRAFAFDGIGACVCVPDSPSLRPANLTVEGWFMFDSSDRSQSIFGKRLQEDAHSYGVGWENGNLQAVLGDGRTGNRTVAVVEFWPLPGQWYHLAFTVDDSMHLVALYVDGVMRGVGMIDDGIDYGDHPIVFGADVGSGGGVSGALGGCIDELTLYDRALAPAAIQALFTVGQARHCKHTLLPSTVVSRQPSE